MRTHTKETQATTTPQMALQFLREGNYRFQNNLKASRDLLQQVNETRDGQFPFATILSCIDSRTGAELIFDQGSATSSASGWLATSSATPCSAAWSSRARWPARSS
jgi:hypothetical protein